MTAAADADVEIRRSGDSIRIVLRLVDGHGAVSELAMTLDQAREVRKQLNRGVVRATEMIEEIWRERDSRPGGVAR